mmetsp:Transcript_7660/g.28841  ORF Transcript_7660/g.28841 Transcript_7660/m.28841 type:complete len:319 (+) Transcript_7660:287-1243(+)
MSLIREHVLQAGHPRRITAEVPVALGDVWRRQLVPGGVKLGARRLGLLHDVRVGADGRLLEVPNKAVHRSGLDEVRGDQHGRHDDLRRDDQRAGHPAGVEHLQADQQVHALVLGLLQEGVDEAVVALQTAERVEVPEGGGNEARHAGDGLEDDEAPLDAAGRGIVGLVPGDEVEGVVQAAHDVLHHVVTEADGRMMLVPAGNALLDLRVRPDVVLLSPTVIRDAGLRRVLHILLASRRQALHRRAMAQQRLPGRREGRVAPELRSAQRAESDATSCQHDPTSKICDCCLHTSKRRQNGSSLGIRRGAQFSPNACGTDA